MDEYTFSEADARSAERLAGIAAAMDPGTFALLDDLGIGGGWHCVDVGAGVGTVVEWLVGRVGSSGGVVATDIDTRWLEGRWGPTVVVRRQDITAEPLEAGEFDLVHTRTVLTHLREWQRALGHLVAGVRPRGWILVEEPDMVTVGRCYPEEPAVDRFGRGLEELMRRNGGDPLLGLRLPSALREVGLRDVDYEVRLSRAEPAAMRAHLDGASGALVGSGLLTADEVEVVASYLEREDIVLYGTVIVAAWGRRPG